MKHDSSVKEQSLHPTSAVVAPPRPQNETQAEEIDERVLTALRAAAEKKAVDNVLLDLREIASFTDFFVITSGSNERQVQAISDAVVETLKKSGSPVMRIEGYKTAEWILLDYGDFVVHVFDEKARKFYDLERLWRESKRVELPSDVAGDSSSLRNES
ncbi:MAG TPA: ribosome silencing factor [Pyrinomonadaceae bacterium]|nr:ribosome silencing factor [Pyrinomonadaceae bacterium]